MGRSIFKILSKEKEEIQRRLERVKEGKVMQRLILLTCLEKMCHLHFQ